MKDKKMTEKDVKNLDKALEQILSHKPEKPLKSPDATPSKADLEQKWRLDVPEEE